MGRIHRYGQRKDCLIFNFVATNTIEDGFFSGCGEAQEIRDALDDDAVFNVVGEVLPAAHVERVLRITTQASLAMPTSKNVSLRMLTKGVSGNMPKRARRFGGQEAESGDVDRASGLAQERRVVPETIARFIREASEYVPLKLKIMRIWFIPSSLRGRRRRFKGTNVSRTELPSLASKYPRCSTDRETAETHNLEWVTPGHPLFEALRRHAYNKAAEVFGKDHASIPATREAFTY